MKKSGSTGLSTLGLIASGVATISVGQSMPRYKLRSNRVALKHDRQAIVSDAHRAFEREFA